MNDLREYQKALYRVLMMIAAADKEFDEQENEVIYDIVTQVLPIPEERTLFIKSMSREMDGRKHHKEFMTVEWFRTQLETLARLSRSSRSRIVDMARRLIRADGLDTHRERFLFEEMRQALAPDKNPL